MTSETNAQVVKHFHDSDIKCSAIVVNFKTLEEINNTSENFLQYLGNYFDDDYKEYYAIFGDFPKRYCIKI